MLYKSSHRVIAAGFIAASLLIAAPPAQAGYCTHNCPTGSGYQIPSAKKPWPPVIGTASSGVPGGSITATATWTPPTDDPSNTAKITGYRVQAKNYAYEQVPHYDAYNQRLYFVGTWVVKGSTTSGVLSVEARSLSMTLPQTGTYTFQVLAINEVGSSPYSAESNRVTGQ
jgi:hypothetical protein